MGVLFSTLYFNLMVWDLFSYSHIRKTFSLDMPYMYVCMYVCMYLCMYVGVSLKNI